MADQTISISNFGKRLISLATRFVRPASFRVAPAPVRVPEGVDLNTLAFRLRMAQVGSCSCLTKTPDFRFHNNECLYRLLTESGLALAANGLVSPAFGAGPQHLSAQAHITAPENT